MYATLEMLKLFHACNAGYSRVLKAIGGPSHGLSTPIPLWMGATTSDGLDDVDWIAERGMIVIDDEFNAMFPNAFPHLLRHVAYVARMNYLGAMTQLLYNELEHPKNTLVHRCKALLDTLADAHLRPEAEVRDAVQFLVQFPVQNGGMSQLGCIRTAAMAAFPEYGRDPMLTCQHLARSARLPNNTESDGRVQLDIPFLELLDPRIQAYHAANEQKTKRSSSKKRVVDMDNDDDDDDDAPVAKTKASKLSDAERDAITKRISALRHLDNYMTRRQLGINNYQSATNRNCIALFLSWFNQADYFAVRKVRHERAWNGTTIDVNTLKNNASKVAVLVHRDDANRITHTAFVVTDPVLISIAAGLIDKAMKEIRSGNLNVVQDDDDDTDEDTDEDTVELEEELLEAEEETADAD